MKQFQESVAGRLLTVAVALPLATGALTTWNPEGSGMALIIVSIIAGIVLAIVGIGLAIDENPHEAFGAILVLPPSMFLYVRFIHIVASAPVVRVAMALAAVTLLAMAFRTKLSSLRFASPRHATHSAS